MRAVFATTLIATASFAHAAPPCLAPGEPLHWIADYCMLKMETDDEIAVSGCIEEEGKRRFPSSCASKLHFKKQICQATIRNGLKEGTLDRCMNDRAFQGRTVRNGGVGG